MRYGRTMVWVWRGLGGLASEVLIIDPLGEDRMHNEDTGVLKVEGESIGDFYQS